MRCFWKSACPGTHPCRFPFQESAAGSGCWGSGGGYGCLWFDRFNLSGGKMGSQGAEFLAYRDQRTVQGDTSNALQSEGLNTGSALNFCRALRQPLEGWRYAATEHC